MRPDDKRSRQRTIRELIAREPIGSQQELVDELRTRGHDVTQATVSRDIAELGLAKVARGDRHVYLSPEDLAPPVRPSGDERLRRILADVPVTIARSGLTLVLVGTAGTANVVAQAIDESSLTEQVGTLAGDNTVLVLFPDETRLERWVERFRSLVSGAEATAAAIAVGRPAAASQPLPDAATVGAVATTEASRS
ncbi:MAG TPA: arginine repressor [Candidatus Dormibacteraeota bacterium]|nr:arginine repressor [Candidatus Dormibacteraeota bacterium]